MLLHSESLRIGPKAIIRVIALDSDETQTSTRGAMKKIKPGLVVAVAVAAIGSGAVVASLILGIGSNRKAELFKCSTDKEIEYIVKSGPEYLIVNPGDEWGRNSFLVSQQVSVLPTNWRFRGIPIKSVSAQGFDLEETRADPFIKAVKFNAVTGSLSVSYAPDGIKPWTLVCKPEGNLENLQALANNVPVEYLLNRKSEFDLINPRLGQQGFNKSLYQIVKSKKHSAYSIYSLLSGLPESQLTGEESIAMKEARDRLIQDNSSEMQIWVFAGTWRYSWEYPGEKEETNQLSNKWCNDQQYATVGEYTSKGYKVVSSSPEIRSTGGWIKQLYPDGRFSGYVNYQAACDGTRYNLKKEGTVDVDNENTAAGYYD